MNDLERMVWAAAFANEYDQLRSAAASRSDRVSGPACASSADVAVLKLREALGAPYAPHLVVTEDDD